MEGNILLCRKKSHFIAFLVLLDGGITISTAVTNLGNILETWGIPYQVNAFSLHNQLFRFDEMVYPEFNP